MLPSHTSFIRDASKVKSQPPRQVMDGIVQGSLDAFQRGAVKGLLVEGGQPKGEKPAKKGKSKADLSHSGKTPATPSSAGFMSYGGASSH